MVNELSSLKNDQHMMVDRDIKKLSLKPVKHSILSLSLFVYLCLVSCGHDHDHDHDHGEHDDEHGEHVHTAPHGGTLVELGEHGSGHNLEVLLDANGTIEIYVLDGHAANFVRVKQEEIELQVTTEGKETMRIALKAVKDPTTDETVGDTSYFRAKTDLSGVKSFEGVLQTLDVKGAKYENFPFRYPEGNE